MIIQLSRYLPLKPDLDSLTQRHHSQAPLHRCQLMQTLNMVNRFHYCTFLTRCPSNLDIYWDQSGPEHCNTTRSIRPLSGFTETRSYFYFEKSLIVNYFILVNVLVSGLLHDCRLPYVLVVSHVVIMKRIPYYRKLTWLKLMRFEGIFASQ